MAKSNTSESNDIGALVREAETAYISGGGALMSKYVTSDLYDDINKIYAYLNSKHTTGETDSKDREKPFFNIVLAARNIYYRATDIDRKNIEVTASKTAEIVPAFVATVHLQNWMRKENFGAFLNDWGIELAGFNSAVVKFVETDGELIPMVVPWSRLIVDQINFDANAKIEILELTEAELYQRNGYDQDMVDRLCDALDARELADHTKQDTRSRYIKLYEVHGNFPLSYLTGKDKDEDTYQQQMHVISFVESKQKGEFDDFTLYSGREEQDPYMLTSLLPATDGSISLNGSVKNLFEAQWMMNHTVKSIKDQLDLASKLIFQTADPNFASRNVLSSIENGDILIHSLNQPLTQVQNNSHDITIQQSFGQMWKGLASEINGISESMLGIQSKSGTAWRQVQAELAEAHDLFELMTENKGLCLEQMLRRFVIRHIKKQMDSSEEIAATLDAHNITKIDAMYVPREAIKRFNDRTLTTISQNVKKLVSGAAPETLSPLSGFDPAQEQAGVQKDLAPLGNKRFFVPDELGKKTWDDLVKDLEWELEIDITGESKDKNAIFTTLTTALTTVMNPLYAGNQQAQLIVSKILSASGVISPLELSALPPPQPAPMAPAVGPPTPGLPIAPAPNA